MAEATAAAGLTILAPAKLNLSLAVLARREDGFHEIESLMVPVSLADTLEVRSQPMPGVTLRVRYAGELAAGSGALLARDVPTYSPYNTVRMCAEHQGGSGRKTDKNPEYYPQPLSPTSRFDPPVRMPEKRLPLGVYPP